MKCEASPRLKPKALPNVDDLSANIVVIGVVGAGVDTDELVDEDDGEAEVGGELVPLVFETAIFLLFFRGRYR